MKVLVQPGYVHGILTRVAAGGGGGGAEATGPAAACAALTYGDAAPLALLAGTPPTGAALVDVELFVFRTALGTAA